MTRGKRILSFLLGAALAVLLLVSWPFSTGLAGVFVYNRF